MLAPGISISGNGGFNATVGAATVPTNYSQGIGMIGQNLAIDTNAPVTYVNGIGVSATGAVCGVDQATTPVVDHYTNGIPCTVDGRIVYKAGSVPDVFPNGNPIVSAVNALGIN
jgi:hypothetical protein